MTVGFESGRDKRSLPVRTRHARLIGIHPEASRLGSLLDSDEDGRQWRSLLANYPDTVVAHCRQQTHRFDAAGLLRHLDCAADILGGGPAVQQPPEYRVLDGIMIPSRRVHIRNANGGPDGDSVSIAIDGTDVTFS
jgi:hypothetical protein